MRFVVNALSVTNLSGRHVLLGHLREVASATVGRHEFDVLYHVGNADMRRDLGPNVHWLECPGWTAHWLTRSVWEALRLPSHPAVRSADWLVSPAGTTTKGISIPQLTFAQNPWCLVPEAHRGSRNALKAALQRRAYRAAMNRAALLVFNSPFMRAAYRANAGCAEAHSFIAYQGLEEETFRAAERLRGSPRDPFRILSVSVMAPHKGIETLVRALERVRRGHGLPATLSLVGGWPDRRYERRIRQLVQAVGLADAVEFRGHVPREELHRAYAEARVFCLMSRCESFGIPAVEAQAFGTPVVSSECCAIPDVCGAGGRFAPATDVDGTAALLARLLADSAEWERLSAAARGNAARYTWAECSRPFLEALERRDAHASRVGGHALTAVS